MNTLQPISQAAAEVKNPLDSVISELAVQLKDKLKTESAAKDAGKKNESFDLACYLSGARIYLKV